MAVAARLSVKGHHVTIFEQADSVGGKAAAFRRDGFIFDTGPSLVTLPAVYRDLFLKTGTALEECVDLQPVELGTAYRWADGTQVTLPGVSPAAVATALGNALGGGRREQTGSRSSLGPQTSGGSLENRSWSRHSAALATSSHSRATHATSKPWHRQ